MLHEPSHAGPRIRNPQLVRQSQSTHVLIVPALVSLLALILRTGRRDKRLPTGPPTVPVLGNLHQIPRKGSYLKFTEWVKQYSGLYFLKLGTATVVVITDHCIIKELIDKKSVKYSNRPALYISHDLMISGDHLLHFMESMVEKYYLKVQNAEAVQMLRDIYVYPDQYMRHSKRFSNSIIINLENWSQLMELGTTPPVDIYPLFHYIPQRLLGNWHSRSKDVGKEMNDLYSGVLIEGGFDTTSSLVLAFIYAMIKWGYVLKKAQVEIDSVIGEDCILGMHYDEAKFSNPDTILAPELAVSLDYKRHDHYGYRLGRRIYPNIYLAERNLFLAFAKLIWAFSIEPGIDENAKPAKYNFSLYIGYSEGFLVYTKDFPCVIKPWSEARQTTIIKELEETQRNVFPRFKTV
ncbi:cytochrome P450 [Aspergillus pseudonomiae]|uniref:Cytochrome P450 n=1 Tax=Aspergillus pseudonomiae TaxID=1506151 RepID=A0A5N7DIV4_9EURO|nr:cytochrome P450 [Aspergillus pseudonomiae]KAE8405933.1 cytochrome P450 [Aspergillus pseudonomiae]